MKELGAYLKRTRVSNGVNIAEAAEDLDLSVPELENIESGNVKAFKDLYELKENIKTYAKYLGLNPEKVVDQFNGFLFEHTSKISIEDIKKAQKKEEEKKERKIKSPYTKEYKPKSAKLPIILVVVSLLILLLILILVLLGLGHSKKPPTRTTELFGEEISYEFAY